MKGRKRFRASIYIDIFIDEYLEDDQLDHEKLKGLEEMREEARQKVQAVVDEITNTENRNIPDEVFNPFIGGIAVYDVHNLVKPLDQNI